MAQVTVCDDRPEPLPVRETWMMPPVGEPREFTRRVGWPGAPRAEAAMGQLLHAIFRHLGFDLADPAVTAAFAQMQEARREWEVAAPAQRSEADTRHIRAAFAYESAVKTAAAHQFAARTRRQGAPT